MPLNVQYVSPRENAGYKRGYHTVVDKGEESGLYGTWIETLKVKMLMTNSILSKNAIFLLCKVRGLPNEKHSRDGGVDGDNDNPFGERQKKTMISGARWYFQLKRANK